MSDGRRLSAVALALVALVAGACTDAAQRPGARPTTTRPAPQTTDTAAASTTTTAAPPSPSTTAPTVPASLFGRIWNALPTSDHVVALTFDAGANADGVASIVATLERTGTPATFFLTGAFARKFPAASSQLPRAGYRLGDHTVDHPHLPSLGDAAVRSEVLDAQATIRSVTGADPAPFFRFPYGDSDARTLGLVNGAGFVAVGWTVDTLGWEGTSGGISTGQVVSRVTSRLGPGEIVLMHVGSNPDDHSTLDADALPAVIDAVRGAGYRLVTIDALLSR